MAKNEHTDGSIIDIRKIQTDHGDDIEVVLKDKDDKVVPDGIKEVDQGVHFDYRNMTTKERFETAATFFGPVMGAIP